MSSNEKAREERTASVDLITAQARGICLVVQESKS